MASLPFGADGFRVVPQEERQKLVELFTSRPHSLLAGVEARQAQRVVNRRVAELRRRDWLGVVGTGHVGSRGRVAMVSDVDCFARGDAFVEHSAARVLAGRVDPAEVVVQPGRGGHGNARAKVDKETCKNSVSTPTCGKLPTVSLPSSKSTVHSPNLLKRIV